MPGEMGDFSPIQKTVAFVAVMILLAIFSVAVGLLIWGFEVGSLYIIGWGIAALIAGFISSGLMYRYTLNRQVQVKNFPSSEQETKTNSKSMLEQHFLYCWNCGTRNSISKDKCDKCGKKLLHE